jgi:hypothetical protein
VELLVILKKEGIQPAVARCGDLNPIELPYSKFKAYLRKLAARTVPKSTAPSARSCTFSSRGNARYYNMTGIRCNSAGLQCSEWIRRSAPSVENRRELGRT